jgi:hypothetical protein
MALALILFLSPAWSAGSQRNAEFELSALSGIGMGELGDRIGRAAWGGSFYAGWLLRGTPFSLGVRLAMANYGQEHNLDLAGYSAASPAGVKYSHNILLTHVVFRAQPRQAVLTPYVEAMVGINYFFTQATLGRSTSVPFVVGDAVLLIDQNESETLLSSVAPSVGLGGGLKLRLARFSPGRKSSGTPLHLYLDLQGRYLVGGMARYLGPGGLALDGDRLVYEAQRSRTDIFCYSLGLSLRKSSRDR